ncbi:hypothetical protein DFQ28_002771 [Apophysomyces sp. BC1034]|nr:hypothetical protein DFQ30_007575 [Apophysomyces sp. BC1015]KAG0170980.1 hypothetical protein DFQ29_009044 [Apophysomyces sp. BC1021]KAG0193896.1 hypothetical protein DFQ28_002771 [Apophysomyces sp. BC1034]
MPHSASPDTRSSFSTPGDMSSSASTAATSTRSENLPDFNEFILDPFDLNGNTAAPSPHRLREARRSFVLRLEPCEGSALHTSLKLFQEQSFVRCPNQAHNTTPHISILGRIHIERGNEFESKWKVVDELVSVIQQEVDRHPHLRPPSFAGYEIVERPTRSLFIRVNVNSVYSQLANAIHYRMANQCATLQVRPMDRIALAYNVLRSVPRPALQGLRDLAKETIDIEDWVLSGGSWQLTLYEVMLESPVVGVQHQLTPIQCWRIHNNDQSSSSMLPVSLRIKLAVLSTRFRLTPKSEHDFQKERA